MHVGSVLCNRNAHAYRYTQRNNYLWWNLQLVKINSVWAVHPVKLLTGNKTSAPEHKPESTT